MRRVYLVYRASQRRHADPTSGDASWGCVATAMLDSAALSYDSAGETHHHYDAFLRMQERGDAALEDRLSWDDEVWMAVDIGSIAPDDSFRDVFDRVQALRPPPPTTLAMPTVRRDGA